MASLFGSIGNAVDTYMLYSIIRKMATKFENWPAFKVGLIDKHGNFLVDKEDRTPEQHKSMSYMDLLILNIKKLLGKIPGGDSKIATFAGALFLLREGQYLPEDRVNRMILEFNFDKYQKEAKILLEDAVASAVPTNNVGSGNVALKNDKTTLLFKKKEKIKKKK
jgi:hypothetical protein